MGQGWTKHVRKAESVVNAPHGAPAAHRDVLDDRAARVAGASLVTDLRCRAGAEAALLAWQAKMAAAIAAAPGFLSVEVVPTSASPVGWRIIQRFSTPERLRQWRQSQACRQLLAEARALLQGDGASDFHEQEAGEAHASVTEVITTRVKAGMEDEFRAWSARIHLAQSGFPGFRGAYLQPPQSERQGYWTTLLRFATPEQLDAWLGSTERRQLVAESEPMVESWENRRLPTSFAGWFPADPAAGKAPAAWKQTMLVLLVLFPIVMLELRFLSPALRELNPALGTFIGNAISVSLVSWLLMPLVIRPLTWWLQPKEGGSTWIAAGGLAILLGLYAAEIGAFWRLL